jgi:carbamoyl-phosphate synthase small subunit
MTEKNAILVLEDGRTFKGTAIGAHGEAFGEVVFNTSLTGYQEIVSDPSYCGQIVAFTAPHIGNYGLSSLDDQAPKPALSAVVVRENSAEYSNWRAEESFDAYLKRHQIVGISEVDTRALTRHIREKGAMRAGIWSGPIDKKQALDKVLASPSLEGSDLASLVTTKEKYKYSAIGERKHKIALIDFGVKKGILKQLAGRGLDIDVLPANTTAEQVLAEAPDGLVLSNGPGDPAAVKSGIECAQALIGRLPILGICLGHQILALALGAKTYKLRFGHHGGNHPVRDEISKEVWITAQNHGFAAEPDSLPKQDIEITHHSLYDGTLEGFASQTRRFIAVQFHPEACPGPSDAVHVFDRFVDMLGDS